MVKEIKNHRIVTQSSILFFCIVLFLGFWFLLIIPEYEKLPDDFSMYIQHEGQDQIEDKMFEGLSKPFRLEENLIQKVIDVDGKFLTIKSSIIGYKGEDKKPIFNSENIYRINRYTLTHIDTGKLYDFGYGVKKQNYASFHPLIFQNSDLIFEGVEQTENFELYVFTSDTMGLDYSSAYPNYKNHTVLGDSFAKLWVEPTTGNLIKFEQNWDIYISDDNEKHTIEKGWKKTTEFTETILQQKTMIALENFIFVTFLIPLFLTILISGIGVLAIVWRNYQNTKKIIREKEKISIVGELASRFSHDVRNPLSNINLALGLLKKDQNIISNHSNKEKLESIQKNIERINHQVDNVLDFIKKPKLEKKEIFLTSCIKETLSSLKIPKNIKINLPRGNYSFYGDPNYMQIVFKNLILNSIQAIGDKEGQITIYFESDATSTTIRIQDSGEGIQDLDLKEIFDPLTTTKQQGTGLGLVSCKNIIESHGGKIFAKNNPTEFTILLPKNNFKIKKERIFENNQV